MNIVFSGLHGTGKSTIAKKIAQEFNFIPYSTGDAFRELAREKGMNLEEFSKHAENNLEIDRQLDNKIISMAKEAIGKGKNYVFDGQLPAYLLGDNAQYKILLKTDELVRIERMADRDGRCFEEQQQETLAREKSEQERFITLYDIDVLNPKQILATFDLIIDTTSTNIEGIMNICKTALNNLLS